MSLKLKKIITESIIDGLNIGKFEKGVLKLIHTYKNEYPKSDNKLGVDEAEIINKISETISYYDYDKLLQIFKFYQKYSDIIFSDVFSDTEINSSLTYPEDETIVNGLLLFYFSKNYYHKRFRFGSFEWEFTVASNDIDEAISEEMFNLEIWLVSNESPSVTIFCGLLPDEKGLGCDMITFDDDFATYNAEFIEGSGTYEEVLGGVYLNIEKPKDLKEDTLKLYFENIIEKVKTELIEKNNWKIESYINDIYNN